jgi:hypothetical protein
MMRLKKWIALLAVICTANLIPTTAPAEATQLFHQGPEIPFIKGTGWVPQGLTYLPSKNWILHSYYWDKGNGSEGVASAIGVSLPSGSNKLISLYETKKRKHFGHVGGITVSHKYLWVASTRNGKSYLFQYSINDLVNAKHGEKIIAKKQYNLNHASSYVTYNYSNHKLCIGKWNPKANGKLYCHSLDNKENMSTSYKTYETPPNVQGVEFHHDLVFYSRSYNRKTDSHIEVYQGLGIKKLVKCHQINSMSEELVRIGENIYVTFESGAKKYHSGGKQQTYHLHYADIQSLL